MAAPVTTASPRLGTVPVFVSDQERALRFYRDRLGYRVVMDQPVGNGYRWLTVAPDDGATQLLLFRPGMFAEGPETADRVGVWTGFVFVTEDIQATYEDLKGRGVEFNGEPVRQPWGGMETSFNDPDGNRFELVEMPSR